MKKFIAMVLLFVGMNAFAQNATIVKVTTSKGDIKIQLDEQNTPVTKANFLQYVNDKFYNGTIFHRVIDGFMIQGGGFSADLQQKKTRAPIINEAKNANPNKRGTVAMARTMDPHSATSQFFINLKDNNFLNFKEEQGQKYGYTVFGHVVDGMDVLDATAKVKTVSKNGHNNLPEQDVIIYEVKVL
jgi:peptidyl-prolyl cis-trans isomerase B (cyclophilin B)